MEPSPACLKMSIPAEAEKNRLLCVMTQEADATPTPVTFSVPDPLGEIWDNVAIKPRNASQINLSLSIQRKGSLIDRLKMFGQGECPVNKDSLVNQKFSREKKQHEIHRF
jgi:hypothetical protein